jgi:uncharacterized protein
MNHRFRFSALALVLLLAATLPAHGQPQAWFAATEQGDLPALQRLAASGQAIDARNAQGQTALLVATHRNHMAVAQWLIARGANVNAQDDISDSPYLLAGARGRLEILRMTLAAGADLRSTNRYGGAAHTEIVRLLLSHGAAPELADGQGVTPLAHARQRGQTNIARLLVAAGARR